MIELLSLVLGGLLRLAPELVKLVSAKRDQAHELAMTTLQLQIDQARAKQQIDQVYAVGNVAADAAEGAALIEALKGQFAPSGIAWIDALSQSVRPITTYWWGVVLYTAYKAITITVALQAGTGLAAMAAVLISDFDRSVIGSMLAFWFVDRSLRRGRL